MHQACITNTLDTANKEHRSLPKSIIDKMYTLLFTSVPVEHNQRNYCSILQQFLQPLIEIHCNKWASANFQLTELSDHQVPDKPAGTVAAQLDKNFTAFVKPESTLPCSKQSNVSKLLY